MTMQNHIKARRRNKNASSGFRNIFNLCSVFITVVMLLYFYLVVAHVLSTNSTISKLDQIAPIPGQPSINATERKNSMEAHENIRNNKSGGSHNTNGIDSVERKIIKQKQRPVATMPRPLCFDNGTPCPFDEIGKFLEDPSKFSIIHAPSTAIPNHRRIPYSMASNATYITSRRESGLKDGSQTALVEYNPTLLPLNSDLDDKLLDYLTGRSHPDITDDEADRAKYLSISRASNLHGCGHGSRRMGQTIKEHSYLSLALLDDNLQAIPGASASVLAYQVLFPECAHEKSVNSPFQDYQIIAARSSKGNKKKDQLFMMASDEKTIITPIDIRRVPGPTNDAEGWSTKIKSKAVPMIPQKDELSNLFYGTGLQVRFMDNMRPPNATDLMCFQILHYHSFDWKKNYHVFDIPDPNGKDEMFTYAELRPHSIRMTRKVNFYAEQFDKYHDWELVPNGTISIFNDGRRGKSDIQSNQFKAGEPPQQFDPPKSAVFRSHKGRGTACCADIDFGKNQQFKVGISHTTTDSRGYISRFYAFDMRPPRFLVVAVSGPFCLGGLNSETDINADMQIFPLADSKHLNATNITYDCPHVTFASGITEYQADKNYVVISYGVNDCYSRSIVVPKMRIIELLDITGAESWRKWNWP